MINHILNIAKTKIWTWPDGLIWRLTESFTLRSRRKKFELFMRIMNPKLEDTILDVGVNHFIGKGTNFLECWYPFTENVTAVTNGDEGKYDDFIKCFPKVKLVFGDGKNLKYPDNKFDIVFSNAVIEHVGNREEQKRFAQELLRVGRRLFITTPNYWFPIELHTLIPLVHWLPLKITFWIYKKLGREYWADIGHLNLLRPKQFVQCFPSNVNIRLYKQRCLGITATLIAVVDKNE